MVGAPASAELERLRAELGAVRKHAEHVELRALEAEAKAARVMAANADLMVRNAHLELMNEKMRRDKYGASSERSRRLLEQLEIAFEDLEADASEAQIEGAIAAAKTTGVQAFARKRATRRDFPADLAREDVVIAPSEQGTVRISVCGRA